MQRSEFQSQPSPRGRRSAAGLPLGIPQPRDLGARIGAVLAILIISVALFAPWIAPHPPARQNLMDAFAPPSRTYLLGTDHLGRDIFSRIVFGTRTTLGTAMLVLIVILAIGLSVGMLAGFVGGWIDQVLMRLVDLLLAFPGLILAIAVAGTLGPGILNVTIALAMVWWAGYARLVRALVLQVREREHIAAAAALGIPRLRILTHHILPNILGPLVVVASLDLGAIVLSIAGLNFLGLGAQPPTPEWGAMLNDAQPFLQTEPQLLLAPAGAMLLTVLAFNLLGDGLRDWLDPQMRHR